MAYQNARRPCIAKRITSVKKGYACHIFHSKRTSNTSLYTQRQVNEYEVLQEQSFWKIYHILP